MGYASKEALLEYTKKDEGKSGSGLFRILGIAGVIMGLASLGTEAGLFFSLICIAGGIFLFYFGGQTGRETKAYMKYLKMAESTGEMQRILNDFANAQSLADDRIRLGSEYIFSKNHGRPVTYAELRKVYPHIVTGSGCARSLVGITVSGQGYTLCDFIVRKSQKDPHPDESYIYQVIVNKNPNVYLGYK